MAIPDHLAHDDEQLVHFLRRQHGGRLIQDKQSRATVKGLDDLHPLLLSHRKLPDIGTRVDLQTVDPGQFHDPRRDPVQVGERAAGGWQSQGDVLRNGQGGHQHEVLVDHPDPEVDRIRRRGDRDRPAVEQDLPFIRVIHAIQDLHQRAFSRAVLTQQGMDLARLHIKIDVIIGKHTREISC